MQGNEPIVIMPCLDMRNGRVVKGVNFVDIRDAGDPVECCRAYCKAGADEIAMLDITATVQKRETMLDVVKRVSKAATVPFTMGGGINSIKAAADVLDAGADKISVSSAAFRDPAMVSGMVREFGAERFVVAVDAAKNPSMPSGYEVFIDGGRTATGKDAAEWAKQIEDLGAATILPTSKSTDGARTGFDLPLIRAVKQAAPKMRVVASGGAGTLSHFSDAVDAGATILLAASVFHFHIIEIPVLKKYLTSRGITLKNPAA